MIYMYLDPPYYGMGFLHQKKTCPTLPSTGPIFAGKGTGHFTRNIFTRHGYLEGL